MFPEYGLIKIIITLQKHQLKTNELQYIFRRHEALEALISKHLFHLMENLLDDQNIQLKMIKNFYEITLPLLESLLFHLCNKM